MTAMARPFKKTIIRYVTAHGRRCTPATPGATRVKQKSKKYYGLVPQPNGKRKAVPLCPDLAKSRQLLNKLLTDAVCASHGMIDAYAEHRIRPLAAHIDDFERHQVSKGNTQEHALQVSNRARKVVESCRFTSISDLSASIVQEHIASLRQGGKSIQTGNFYLQAIKQFCRWMVRDRRMSDSPVAHLSGGNVRLDRRRERREVSDAELAYLFANTRKAGCIRKMSGADREMLYLTSLFTGLRASELASLTPASFALDNDQPVVTVEAVYSKHRRQDIIPLHPDLVHYLHPWLAGKPAQKPVWPGNWAKSKKAGAMFKVDLSRARAAWIGEATDFAEKEQRGQSSFLAYFDGGRYADFHALRHTFISRLVRAGVRPKEAQALARHSTITLTMDRYDHTGLHDVATAIMALPSLPGSLLDSTALKATGTDGKAPKTVEDGCTQVAQNQDLSGPLLASIGTNMERVEGSAALAQPHALSSEGTSCHLQAAEGVGFEPTDDSRRRRFSRPVPSAARPPLRAVRTLTEVGSPRKRTLLNCHCFFRTFLPILYFMRLSLRRAVSVSDRSKSRYHR